MSCTNKLARWWALGLTASVGLGWPGAARETPAPVKPPGFNVYMVEEQNGGRFWRGGAPRRHTLQFLARTAKERGRPMTLFDLRHPATRDDRSGARGRLTPDHEKQLARSLGLRYVSISAMDRNLPRRLRTAMEEGDVYLHCMYGVNRTGFATARYARVFKVFPDRKGLGARDWQQGERFQVRLERGSQVGGVRKE